MLRRAINPQFQFNDTMSVTETWPEKKLLDRNGTRSRFVGNNRILTSRAIRIPKNNAPVSEMIEFDCLPHWGIHSTITLLHDTVISYERIISYTWKLNSQQPNLMFNFVLSKQIVINDYNSEKSEIRICARLHHVINPSSGSFSRIEINQ